jgi:hypothetical protein
VSESCWSGVLLVRGLAVAGDAGVVDQDVQGAGLPCGIGDARVVGHVEDEQPGIAAYLPDGALSSHGIARADVDGQACVRELAGNLLADSLVGTCDERDQVVHAVEVT